jgi:hypothetical protein
MGAAKIFFEIYYFITFIHTIQSHSVHPSPFAEARLLFECDFQAKNYGGTGTEETWTQG